MRRAKWSTNGEMISKEDKHIDFSRQTSLKGRGLKNNMYFLQVIEFAHEETDHSSVSAVTRLLMSVTI